MNQLKITSLLTSDIPCIKFCLWQV